MGRYQPPCGGWYLPFFFGPPDSFRTRPSWFQLPFYMPPIPCHPPTDAPTCLHYCSMYGSVHASILHASTYASIDASLHASMVTYLPYFYCWSAWRSKLDISFLFNSFWNLSNPIWLSQWVTTQDKTTACCQSMSPSSTLLIFSTSSSKMSISICNWELKPPSSPIFPWCLTGLVSCPGTMTYASRDTSKQFDVYTCIKYRSGHASTHLYMMHMYELRTVPYTLPRNSPTTSISL